MSRSSRSRLRRAGAALLLLAALAPALNGCASGGNAATRYYVIDPEPAEALRAGDRPLTVEILGLTVPQYLERFQIATRAGPDRLRFSDTHQWGETLRKNLLRTLARNLSTRLATVDIGTPVERTARSPDYRLTVAIQQFERDEDGTVRIAATWQVIDIGAGDRVRSFASEHASSSPVPSGDYDALVARMRDLFGRLSGEIAASIAAEPS